MFEWWFVIICWICPLYWIIGLAVIYGGKSLEDKVVRALFWFMLPFLSPFLLLSLCYFVKFVYVFNLTVPLLISAFFVLGFLIFKVCEKEIDEGKI